MFTSVYFYYFYAMAKKLFVGNISWNAEKEQLEELFSQHGDVENVILIRDEEGRSKGFGFVEFASDEDAQSAKDALNGFSFMERDLFVNDARERESR